MLCHDVIKLCLSFLLLIETPLVAEVFVCLRHFVFYQNTFFFFLHVIFGVNVIELYQHVNDNKTKHHICLQLRRLISRRTTWWNTAGDFSLLSHLENKVFVPQRTSHRLSPPTGFNLSDSSGLTEGYYGLSADPLTSLQESTGNIQNSRMEKWTGQIEGTKKKKRKRKSWCYPCNQSVSNHYVSPLCCPLATNKIIP